MRNEADRWKDVRIVEQLRWILVRHLAEDINSAATMRRIGITACVSVIRLRNKTPLQAIIREHRGKRDAIRVRWGWLRGWSYNESSDGMNESHKNKEQSSGWKC